MRARSFLGYPEPDGGCPFSVIVRLQEKWLLVAGIFNTSDGLRDLESSLFTDVSEIHLVEHLQQNALIEVVYSHFLWLFNRCLSDTETAEELEIINMMGLAEEPLCRKIEFDREVALRTAPLMHPQTGVFYPLQKAILSDGIKGLIVALQNSDEVQRKIIDASVDTCADVSLDPELRILWGNVLDALSLIYLSQGKEDEVLVAQQNRLALELGLSGMAVPFVRDWVNQQLANALAIAQLMTRDSKDQTS